jgi:phospholipid-binding lipoprotein MlaA
MQTSFGGKLIALLLALLTGPAHLALGGEVAPGSATTPAAASSSPAGLNLSSEDATEAQSAPYDPLVPVNEKILNFNKYFDDHVSRPIAEAWARVLPYPVRRGLQRFFRNLGETSNAINCALQQRYRDAGQSAARFLINSTLGFAGIFDVADNWFGIKPHRTDFGLTLAHYGIDFGPYLMYPAAGPSTLRDAVCGAADGAANPMSAMVYTLPFLVYTPVFIGLGIIYGINERSFDLPLFEDVDRYSVDLYGAVQDGYYQARRNHQVPYTHY